MIFSVETDIPKWKELKCKKTFYVETDNMPDKILKFRVGEVECSFEGNFDIEIHIRKSVYEKLLSGEYDSCDAIIDMHPGAGGTESQDWCSMLFRISRTKNG